MIRRCNKLKLVRTTESSVLMKWAQSTSDKVLVLLNQFMVKSGSHLMYLLFGVKSFHVPMVNYGQSRRTTNFGAEPELLMTIILDLVGNNKQRSIMLFQLLAVLLDGSTLVELMVFTNLEVLMQMLH